ADAEAAARGGLGVLLPARITGVRELTSLRSIDEGIPTPAAPFPVAACERLPGAEEVLGAYRAPAGLGRCILVPFDASLRPVSDWGGLERRWSEWLDLRRPSMWGLPYRRMADRDEAMRAWWEARKRAREERDREREGFVTAASSGRRHLLGWFFALLAGFALAAGPLEWFGLRRLGRQPWTWATFPLLVALACAGGWMFGVRSLPRGPEVTVLGVLDVWPEGARETSILSVTAPANLRCDLHLGARDARLWSCEPGEPEDPGKRVPPTLFSGGPSPSAREVELKAWRPRLMILTADLPPSAFRLEATEGELRFHAPGPLRGARWMTGGEPIPLGDLRPGEPVPRGPSGPGLPFPSGSFQAGAAAFLAAFEAGVPEGGHRLVVPTPEHPVLAGWLETSPSAPSIAGRPPVRALLFVRIHPRGPR
ncbi:MAG: hypothetical protein HUU15_18590, partial [Candidatus Brocadiae bacterium]|nr:hypothetical protein [Candidatus Brocadiia bacterium]